MDRERARARAQLAACRVPPHHGRMLVSQVERAVHEREVRESLRKVPEQPLLIRVVLLRDQTEVVRQREKAFEQRVRLVVPPEQLETVDEPERAREENALARGQAVDAVLVR